MVKRFLQSFIPVLALLIFLCPAAKAEERAQYVDVWVTGTGYADPGFLCDGEISGYATSFGPCSLTVESNEAFSALYLTFNWEYGDYTITDNQNGLTYNAGRYEYLHEYVALDLPTNSVTIDFTKKPVTLSEIQAFTHGTPPNDIQVWQPPLDGKADLLLMSTHGDDEHLFFAGLLPLYAKERGYDVQVAYLTDHRNLTTGRTHEMLNGLWAVGVRNYPVFGRFLDFRLDDLEMTYAAYASHGTTREDLMGYVVEQLRRFKPKVVVGHDFKGEYGHGMHQVYTDLLVQALDIIPNEECYPHSAQKYGTWQVQKTYIHLYKENPIVMEYDSPLESFGGMTAFEVSQQIGFPCHQSQRYELESGGYIYGLDGRVKTATDIKLYSPCEFGLYRSTVGPDAMRNDFMENIISNQDLLRQEQERLEAERLEQERLEAERAQQTETAPTTQAPTATGQSGDTPPDGGRDVLLLVLLCICGVTVVGVVLLSIAARKRRAK